MPFGGAAMVVTAMGSSSVLPPSGPPPAASAPSSIFLAKTQHTPALLDPSVATATAVSASSSSSSSSSPPPAAAAAGIHIAPHAEPTSTSSSSSSSSSARAASSRVGALPIFPSWAAFAAGVTYLGRRGANRKTRRSGLSSRKNVVDCNGDDIDIGIGFGSSSSINKAVSATAGVARRAVQTFVAENGEEYTYDTDALLGEGGQGKVYAGKQVRTQEDVAVKVVPVWRYRSDVNGKERLQRIDREARKQMLMGRHPNIAQLFALVDVFRPGTRDHPQYKILVMELVKGQELADLVERRGPLGEALSKTIFRQLVAAVEHIHSLDHVHRDLKVENILVHFEKQSEQSDEPPPTPLVKVIDFGVTRRLFPGETFSTVAGTLSIRPPEVAAAIEAALPPESERRTRRASFKAPSEEYPGFRLLPRTANGRGAQLVGVEPGTAAAEQGLEEGWAVSKVNGRSVLDMLFKANPDDSSHAGMTSIVQVLEELPPTEPFELEFIEMPARRFTQQVDVWALGVVLYTMLAGRLPFASNHEIAEGSYDTAALPEGLSPEVLDLLQGLLCKDPDERLTLPLVMAHPWLTAG